MSVGRHCKFLGRKEKTSNVIFKIRIDTTNKTFVKYYSNVTL